MKITLVLVLISLSLVPTHAQQGSPSKTQGRPESSRKGPRRASAPPACKDLKAWGEWVDANFEKAFDHLDPSDHGEVWQDLIECANQTHSTSQQIEALRVVAMWERIREDALQNALRKAEADVAAMQPVSAPECQKLQAVGKQLELLNTPGAVVDAPLVNSIESILTACEKASRELNPGRAATPEWGQARSYRATWMTYWHNQLAVAYNDLLDQAKENDRLATNYIRSLEKDNAVKSGYANTTQAYINSLNNAVLWRSLSPTSCTGTFYNYGTWGTATSNCQ